MKLGFLTAPLPQMTLEAVAAWAAAQGFEAVELAAWPVRAGRRKAPRHRQLDVATLTKEEAADVRAVFASHGLTISALAYYENNLHPNPKKRKEILAHLRQVIRAASLLQVDLVGTFVGARPVRPDTVMKEAGKLFRRLVQEAEGSGVRLMIENCPMENWVRFGLPGNYAYSPELWEALFNEVPSDHFGLNFDPSHLYWLGIDHLQAVRDFAGRIFHAHAKDAELLPRGLYRYGVLARQLEADPWKSGWWRYRLPGKGAIDWQRFIEVLQEAGYDGVLSIEHEDPEYEGSEDEVKAGLRLGYRHLRQHLPQ
jgi:sugar phosphate isomerase/epimerase